MRMREQDNYLEHKISKGNLTERSKWSDIWMAKPNTHNGVIELQDLSLSMENAGRRFKLKIEFLD